jgi:membrane protease YdiL (CAAX protease family)
MAQLQNRRDKLYIFTAILMVGPFYLNDFSNIFISDWRWWLFIDYTAVKCLPLILAFWLIYSNKMQAFEFGLRTQSLFSFIVTFVIVALIGTVIDQNGKLLIATFPGYTPLGGMPEIISPVWNWVDLTFGLLLVGVCEELVFRGYLCTFISRYTESSFAIVLLSSVAFGFIHWSSGLHAVIISSVIGAVFMTAYLLTRSLPAIILAHFAINFIDFAGVIPESMFKFT